jgi:hypothetical protein
MALTPRPTVSRPDWGLTAAEWIVSDSLDASCREMVGRKPLGAGR